MIPKTEKELELYFLLEDLKEARDKANLSIFTLGSSAHYNANQTWYNKLKKEYLEKVK